MFDDDGRIRLLLWVFAPGESFRTAMRAARRGAAGFRLEAGQHFAVRMKARLATGKQVRAWKIRRVVNQLQAYGCIDPAEALAAEWPVAADPAKPTDPELVAVLKFALRLAGVVVAAETRGVDEDEDEAEVAGERPAEGGALADDGAPSALVPDPETEAPADGAEVLRSPGEQSSAFGAVLSVLEPSATPAVGNGSSAALAGWGQSAAAAVALVERPDDEAEDSARGEDEGEAPAPGVVPVVPGFRKTRAQIHVEDQQAAYALAMAAGALPSQRRLIRPPPEGKGFSNDRAKRVLRLAEAIREATKGHQA
jgi:hypothetical protein